MKRNQEEKDHGRKVEACCGGRDLGSHVSLQDEIFFSDRGFATRRSVPEAGRVDGGLGCYGAREEGTSGAEREDSRRLNIVDEDVENCVDSRASAEGDGGVNGVRRGPHRQSLESSRKRRGAWTQMRKAAIEDQKFVARRGR